MRKTNPLIVELAQLLYTETGKTLGEIGQLLGYEKEDRGCVYSLVKGLPVPPHRGRGKVGWGPHDALIRENQELREKVARLETRLLSKGDTKGIAVSDILERIKVSVYDQAATGDLKELAAVLRPLLLLEERDRSEGKVNQDGVVAEVLREVKLLTARVAAPAIDAPHSEGEVPESEEQS